ncbi:MAG: MATE family efflux transporter [Pseudoflavonifractor sp.]|nr:MATE family efflux transporter [Alloprevotella sp.]MCM1117067.1 MATE family efflux transporter [Pseudoflavonifractor sp.]
MRQSTGAPYGRIFMLGLPIIAGQVGMIATGFADTAMVGRYSTAALASAAFVNNLFNIPIMAILGFTFGLTPLCGALFGRGSLRRVGGMVANGLAINLLFVALMTALMGILYFYLDRLGQPAELLPIIRPYYLISLAGLLPIAIFNVFAQWSYATRLTSMPMWITLTANAVNVLGNYLLIYGHAGLPEMGLTGAGIATLLSRLFCPMTIILIFLTCRRFRPYRLGYKATRIDRRTMARVGRTSLPISLQMSFETAAFSGTAVMAGWIGAVALASFQVIVTLGTLGFCIYYGMGAAVSVLVANYAGRREPAAMRATAMRGYVLLLGLAACSSALFLGAGRHIISLFTADPVVISASAALIVPLLIYQAGDATQICFANALRGTSNVMPMLWIAFVCYIIVGLPSTYLLAFPAGLGVYGMVLSFSVSLFLAGALFLRSFLATVSRLPR